VGSISEAIAGTRRSFYSVCNWEEKNSYDPRVWMGVNKNLRQADRQQHYATGTFIYCCFQHCRRISGWCQLARSSASGVCLIEKKEREYSRSTSIKESVKPSSSPCYRSFPDKISMRGRLGHLRQRPFNGFPTFYHRIFLSCLGSHLRNANEKRDKRMNGKRDSDR
jgi:hypothetical protein